MNAESEKPQSACCMPCACQKCGLILGIIFIILGIAAAVLVPASAASAKFILGGIFLLGGALQSLYAFRKRGKDNYIFYILNSLLFLAVGSILAVHSLTGILSLALLIAMFFMTEGLLKIAMGLRLRSEQKEWGYAFFHGILALILAMLIFLQWPNASPWVYGLLAGIDLAFGGWVQIIHYMAERDAPCAVG